jgi:1,4-dihydroxy-2-naphthoate polyprenyltransferase
MLRNPSIGWGKTVVQVLRLGRLHFVAAGLLLFLFGALLAGLHGADLALRRLILGYLAFFPAHLSVSYSNDYFDANVDSLGRPTLFTGGSGVLTANPQLRPLARRLAIGLMACSLVAGLAFTLVYDYPLWFLAYLLAGNALGWSYSAPPLRLSARGLGEIATTLTVGLAVPSMGYLVMQGRLDSAFWLMAPPLLLVGLAFILLVEIPDMEADRKGGKKTLVSREGRRFGFVAVGALFAAMTALFGVLAVLYPEHPARLDAISAYALVPAVPAILAAVHRPVHRAVATRYVNVILVALVTFVAVTDAHLIWLLVR